MFKKWSHCLDAVAKGSIDSTWITPLCHVSTLGAAHVLFTVFPFGPRPGEFVAWK